MNTRILLIEPYLSDSHRQLIHALTTGLAADWTVLHLPPRKWKWRMRGAAVHFSNPDTLPPADSIDMLFCSSFLNLAEFLGLAPSYASKPKVVYFHENQFAYPVIHAQERDFHFSMTNITTALAADRVVFNSRFNKDSFLESIPGFLKKMPDFQPHGIRTRIEAKSIVLPVPLSFTDIDRQRGRQTARGPVVIWNHRWEHDKGPETFFKVLLALADHGLPFKLIVLGGSPRNAPSIFETVRRRMKERILHMGYCASREDYSRLLCMGRVVVSTALQEFYGISVLEAVRAGCLPLLPDRLAYPERYPQDYLYADEGQLRRKLQSILASPPSGPDPRLRTITEAVTWEAMRADYQTLLQWP